MSITGDSDDNLLIGTPGDDVFNGLDGNDIFMAAAGNDRGIGGDGNDTLFGGPGNDRGIGGRVTIESSVELAMMFSLAKLVMMSFSENLAAIAELAAMATMN